MKILRVNNGQWEKTGGTSITRARCRVLPNFGSDNHFGAGSTTFVPSTGASTGSYSAAFAFSGGVSFCTQCGSPGMYACSDKSSWTGGNLTFLDQTPSGNTITSFLLTTTGSYACGSGISSLMIGAVQNTAITTAIAAPTTNHCACNTCDGAVTVSSSEFPWGFALNYGGKNTFSLSVFNNPACLDETTLTAYYKPSAPYYATGITVNSPSNDPSVICGRGGALFCSITSTCTILSFNDPLPKGSLLISATVNIFGNFFPRSPSCADSRQGYVTFAAQTFSPTSISNSDSCFNTNSCSAPWSNSSPSLYENGLAGYRYGASDSFTLTITSKGTPH